MTKSFYYIGVLIGMFLFDENSCFAKDDSLKLRQNIRRLARKISHYKTVDFGLVGFSPVNTKQYERSMTLSGQATDRELVLLTDHKSPKVRVYAFDILAARKHKDLKSILEKHILDSAIFTSRSGCMRGTDRVNWHFLDRLTPRANRDTDITLSNEEVEYYKNKMSTAVNPRMEK